MKPQMKRKVVKSKKSNFLEKEVMDEFSNEEKEILLEKRNTILGILESKCSMFLTAYRLQAESRLDRDQQFLVNSFFVNSNNEAIARGFAKLDTKNASKNLREVEKLIEKRNEEQKYAPVRCSSFGCSEEQIQKCHKKLRRNENNEITNSPAAFIQESIIKESLDMQKRNSMIENIMLRLESGDKLAYLDESFLQALKMMQKSNILEYERLLHELENMGVKPRKLSKILKNIDIEADTETISKAVNNVNDSVYSEYLPILKSQQKYSIGEDGELYGEIQLKDEIKTITISNFVAKIDRKIFIDDGREEKIIFEISGILSNGSKLQPVKVEAKNFRRMNWELEMWGSDAIIYSGNNATDMLREFIQLSSQNAEKTIMYHHLGWRKIDGHWSYLYPNGCIGAKDVMVDDIQELRGYGFTDGDLNIKKAVKASVDFLSIAPHKVTMPLLGHAYLSIMVSKLLEAKIPPKYMLFIGGPSGNYKTTLSLLLLSHFGTFDSPPMSFSDTINAMERKSFLAKDSLIVCDDLFPSTTASAMRYRMEGAQRLSRAYGDRIGKGRARSNLTLSKEYRPMGNLIANGEDFLQGASTNARNIGIHLNKSDVDLAKLTELQSKKEYLNAAMKSFISWSIEHIMEKDEQYFIRQFKRFRTKATKSGQHSRFAESVAWLQIGFLQFIKFAKSKKAITNEQYSKLKQQSFEVFLNVAEAQNSLVQEETPPDKFLSALMELITMEEVKVLPINQPAHMKTSTSNIIGWEDENMYYLAPKHTYNKVNEFFMRRGEIFGISERMLWKMMADNKLIQTDKNTNDAHIHPQKVIGMTKKRLVHIPKRLIHE